jgi:hypothetical protein
MIHLVSLVKQYDIETLDEDPGCCSHNCSGLNLHGDYPVGRREGFPFCTRFGDIHLEKSEDNFLRCEQCVEAVKAGIWYF